MLVRECLPVHSSEAHCENSFEALHPGISEICDQDDTISNSTHFHLEHTWLISSGMLFIG